jgi:3',5'-cyclic AMP phosphodiesterase CpdA
MLRLCGDVHGKWFKYHTIVKDAEFSLQLGDLGWRDSYEFALKYLDPNKHKVVLGNHEDYDYIDEKGLPHSLGDFGYTSFANHNIFFVRGAFSIDRAPRINHYFKTGIKSWFEQEELSYSSLMRALELYQQIKPDLVITHDTPQVISEMVGKPDVLRNYGFEPPLKTKTQLALQSMFDFHQPKAWYFGHYHRKWQKEVCGTNFKCLDELEYVDI